MLTPKKRKTLGKSLSCPRNRHGEPMVCSPTDALNMLYGSDLQFLIMENVLVKKPDAPTL
jgi:carbamoyltransferase